MRKSLLTLLLVLILVSDSAFFTPTIQMPPIQIPTIIQNVPSEEAPSEEIALEEAPLEVAVAEAERLMHRYLYSTDKDLFLKMKFIDEVGEMSYDNGVEGACMFLNGIIGLYAVICFFGIRAILSHEYPYRSAVRGDPIQDGWARLKTFAFSTGVSFVLAGSLYKVLTKLISWLPRKNYHVGTHYVLREFLINWESYKVCTPARLHPLFDKLSKRSDLLGALFFNDPTAYNVVQDIKILMDETSEPQLVADILAKEEYV